MSMYLVPTGYAVLLTPNPMRLEPDSANAIPGI